METTGLGQQVVWGLYIAGFFTAMGAGAVLICLAGLSEFSPRIPADRRRSLLLLAVGMPDRRRPVDRHGRGQPAQPVAHPDRWPVQLDDDLGLCGFLIVTGVLAWVDLVLIWKQPTITAQSRLFGGIGRDRRVVPDSRGGLDALHDGSPSLWSGGLMVVNFLSAALVAGLSITLLAWPDLNQKLAGWMKMGLWATLSIVTIEGAHCADGQGGAAILEKVSQLLAGAFSPMFWIYLVAGLLIPRGIANSGRRGCPGCARPGSWRCWASLRKSSGCWLPGKPYPGSPFRRVPTSPRGSSSLGSQGPSPWAS